LLKKFLRRGREMKRMIGLVLFVSAVMVSAQEITTAPVNPELVKYMEAKANGTLVTKTGEGHSLGYIPEPLEYVANKETAVEPRKLPSVYDLRALGYMTIAKNQGSCGSCWSFATYGNIESRRLFLGEGTWDLSENNLKQDHGFDWGPCDGGNGAMSTAYLTRGHGAILEADDPYYAGDKDNWNSNPPAMYIYDAFVLPRDNAAIKQAVYDFGAIYTNMYWGDTYYNSSNKTYYYNGANSTNHAVTIAGWDDGKVTAGGTGAWIIKNSWGATWGESGYFYISYNDSKVNSSVYYWPSKINYDSTREINFYDKLGNISNMGYGSTAAYALVKFVPSSNHTITKLGTYVATDGSTIGFQVYDDKSSNTLSNLLGSISNTVIARSGYATLDLPTPINVTAGNDIYVKVYYNTPGYNFPIPFETAYSGYANPVIETGVFWFSSTGSTWTAAGQGTSYLRDPCVKSYGAVINLDIPQNVVTSASGSNITVSWDLVSGATSYVVYSANDPYGTFAIDTSGTLNGTSWTAPATAAKKFYYVIATNAKTKVYDELKVSR
jgi:C1A family cysteine protease